MRTELTETLKAAVRAASVKTGVSPDTMLETFVETIDAAVEDCLRYPDKVTVVTVERDSATAVGPQIGGYRFGDSYEGRGSSPPEYAEREVPFEYPSTVRYEATVNLAKYMDKPELRVFADIMFGGNAALVTAVVEAEVKAAVEPLLVEDGASVAAEAVEHATGLRSLALKCLTASAETVSTETGVVGAVVTVTLGVESAEATYEDPGSSEYYEPPDREDEPSYDC